MATQAQIKAVLEDEAPGDGEDEAPGDGNVAGDRDVTSLSIELDAIPGAVWRTELESLMPPDIRVTLFERGTQKLALLTFPPGQRQTAYDAFEQALQAANSVSQQSHRLAQAAREARQR